MKTRAGDWVEVRSKEEILRTLDKSGRLDGLPFMPQMFNYCGQCFRVHSNAYKTCDTVSGHYVGRSLPDAGHLNMRCDGQAFSGQRMFCPRSINLWWREIWLERVSTDAYSGSALPIPAGTCSTADKGVSSAGDVTAPAWALDPLVKG